MALNYGPTKDRRTQDMGTSQILLSYRSHIFFLGWQEAHTSSRDSQFFPNEGGAVEVLLQDK